MAAGMVDWSDGTRARTSSRQRRVEGGCRGPVHRPSERAVGPDAFGGQSCGSFCAAEILMFRHWPPRPKPYPRTPLPVAQSIRAIQSIVVRPGHVSLSTRPFPLPDPQRFEKTARRPRTIARREQRPVHCLPPEQTHIARGFREKGGEQD